VARLLQKFHFEMDDPAYALKIKHTLTIKPLDFFMKAKLRADMPTGVPVAPPTPEAAHPESAASTSNPPNARIAIFFASNSGEYLCLCRCHLPGWRQADVRFS
jgi:cytochrome P450/NADPH-cytochrome P450 reductase